MYKSQYLQKIRAKERPFKEVPVTKVPDDSEPFTNYTQILRQPFDVSGIQQNPFLRQPNRSQSQLSGLLGGVGRLFP